MGKHRIDHGIIGRIFKVIAAVFKYGAIAAITVAFSGMAFFVSYLMGLNEWKEFDPAKIGEMQLTLLIYDKNGVETAALYNSENRVYVPFNMIPEHVKNAFIAIEDSRFYKHNGIDFIRIAGALADDLKHGSLKQGASTISQQLVKNTSLTGVKTISRKLQEAVMAYKLEQAYTKDEILEMYLNYIPFGKGAFGIEAAAKAYFGTNAASLSLAQAAMLAGIIKAPTRYAPHLNMQNSIKRRNLVLSEMVKSGFISSQESKKAQTEPVVLAENNKFNHGYYIDMVLGEAEELLHIDSEELLSGGYRIYTTLDQKLQKIIDSLYEDESNFPPDSRDGEQCQSAFVVLDSKTSEVRALVGGRSYETRRGINRAADIKRQPGSAIKPILVYAPAMEKLRYTPTTLVLDEKEDFNGYVPKNFTDSYEGWVTLRHAACYSLNLPAVRLLSKIGIQPAKLFASSVGITFEEQDLGLTLALGGFTKGVSPLCLAGAYTPFANGGCYSLPSCISKIENGRGEIVYERADTRTCVISDKTAFFMTSMLKSAAETGTARRVHAEGVDIAAKTGTSGADSLTGGNRDVWTVAYNPEYTMCCWMGFDNTDDAHCLPAEVTGGTYPAILIQKLFSDIYGGAAAPVFTKPKGVIEAKIDIKSVLTEDKPMLASAFTPDDQTALEYFLEENAPTEYTSYWSVPIPPDTIEISHGSGGYPSVSFTPMQEHIIYRLMRRDVREGVNIIIGEYNGAVSALSISDFTAEYGHTYDYYVVPVHPEIKIKGERLCGPPSKAVRITVNAEENYMP